MIIKIGRSFVPDIVVMVTLIVFILTSNDVGAMIYALAAAGGIESVTSILRAYALSEIIKDNKG